MYKFLLISKYLRKRRIAWVSVTAVMLCTAMVLVVLSVMGGWLGMFRSSFQGLSGDILVRAVSRTGFQHYDDIARRLEARPEVEAAAPFIETFGLITLDNQIQEGVRVVGIDMERVGRVNQFWESLYLQQPDTSPADPLDDYRRHVRQRLDADAADLDARVGDGHLDAAVADDLREYFEEVERPSLERVEAWAQRRLARGGQTPTFELPFEPDVYRAKLGGRRGGGREGGRGGADPATFPGMIVATGVVGIRKGPDGDLFRWPGLFPDNPLYARLVVLALDPDGATTGLEQAKDELQFWAVDNSRTGVFNTDEQTVYVDFRLLQRSLRMGEQQVFGVNPDTGDPTTEVIRVEPSRINDLHVKLAPGIGLEAGKNVVEQVVRQVHADVGIDPRFPVRVETWEERYRDFLGAVERERGLVTILFGLISVVAIFLVFCIFYMIVAEKTKDIGIVKSVGATDTGIAAIFLGYGAAIGVVGGGLGVLAGGTFVMFINEIHDLLGRVAGVQVWNAQTYLFDRIPDRVDPFEALIIFVVAVISSVIGATVPAWRAARLHPVDALRFE